jgi:hypothetical protein
MMSVEEEKPLKPKVDESLSETPICQTKGMNLLYLAVLAILMTLI